MKTITDLFELILNETKLNEGKILKFTFELNTRYNYVSMHEHADIKGHEQKQIFSHMSITTPEQLQLVYWTIYNNGRTKNI